ncbi:hypothetical protein TWF694_005155 [Orbilia ellipsospora]|uniref:F-box domain-containing protein n=1 Tax=Orbilia ellipsospora TaxID=2528407 RepID=A0AAV9WUR6_9PEZI
METPIGISRLPSELLVEIFECLDDNILQLETHVKLAQVCTLWYRITSETPSLKSYRYNLVRIDDRRSRNPGVRKVAVHSIFNAFEAIRCTVQDGEVVRYSTKTEPHESKPSNEARRQSHLPNSIEEDLPSLVLEDACFGDDQILRAIFQRGGLSSFSADVNTNREYLADFDPECIKNIYLVV